MSSASSTQITPDDTSCLNDGLDKTLARHFQAGSTEVRRSYLASKDNILATANDRLSTDFVASVLISGK